MQGIENITNRLKADAQAEIDRINSEADQEIEKINASYAQKAEKEAQAILDKGEITAKERESRLISSAQMEAKQAILASKQKLINDAFERALEKLTQLPEEDYINLLANLAGSVSSKGKGSLVFNSADKNKVGKKVVSRANKLCGGNMTLSAETAPIKGGFVLKDGPIEVNCSLETLIKSVRSEVTGEVNAVLFG